MDIQQSIFYAFSAVLLFAAFMVITTRHPVRGIMFLILAFFASSLLWILLEAEFLALVLVFVYVGAVMTLFLFVVMMLNVEVLPGRKGIARYLPAGILVAGVLITLMLQALGVKHFGLEDYPAQPLHPADYSNIKALGDVLYTQYVLPFELSAVILLVAIISAINLAFRGRRQNNKLQNIATQIAANKGNRLRIIANMSKTESPPPPSAPPPKGGGNLLEPNKAEKP